MICEFSCPQCCPSDAFKLRQYYHYHHHYHHPDDDDDDADADDDDDDDDNDSVASIPRSLRDSIGGQLKSQITLGALVVANSGQM